MNKDNIVQILQKYRKICRLLTLEDDVKQFDELIYFIRNNEQKISMLKIPDTVPPKKYGEEQFEELAKKTEINLEDYIINPDIIKNKDNIFDFWNSIDVDIKEKFTIFELNVMLFLISKQYNKYMKKDKKRIIAFLTEVAKSKRMEKSYKEIQV